MILLILIPWLAALIWFHSLVLRMSVRRCRREHDAYAKDREEVRKRPGFHDDHRRIAIYQRVRRDLRRWPVRVSFKKVQKILKEID